MTRKPKSESGRLYRQLAQIRDTRALSPNERLLLMTLALRQGPAGIFPSLSTIALDTGLHRSTVCRVLDALEGRGVLSRIRRPRFSGAHRALDDVPPQTPLASSTVYRLHLDVPPGEHEHRCETNADGLTSPSEVTAASPVPVHAVTTRDAAAIVASRDYLVAPRDCGPSHHATRVVASRDGGSREDDDDPAPKRLESAPNLPLNLPLNLQSEPAIDLTPLRGGETTESRDAVSGARLSPDQAAVQVVAELGAGAHPSELRDLVRALLPSAPEHELDRAVRRAILRTA